MESADSRQAEGSDRQYVEIEVDRPTLALVVDNLQHFAGHYDDWGFIDKATVHVTLCGDARKPAKETAAMTCLAWDTHRAFTR
ncbi:hypothetical protein [Thauera sp. SDU_THAU2]|uniref:hypothetical protein n=1 Tax=Thauera sp. SDU_THAU2 TaxID=3136633 RepID=UPI00311E9257